MQHLSEKVKSHESSKIHMDCCLTFSAFRRVNITAQLNNDYRLAVYQGKDENNGSNNPGIFCGLVDFVASLERYRRNITGLIQF